MVLVILVSPKEKGIVKPWDTGGILCGELYICFNSRGETKEETLSFIIFQMFIGLLYNI